MESFYKKCSAKSLHVVYFDKKAAKKFLQTNQTQEKKNKNKNATTIVKHFLSKDLVEKCFIRVRHSWSFYVLLYTYVPFEVYSMRSKKKFPYTIKTCWTNGIT